MLIFAGAGSGKTRTLTHRIAYLIGEHRVSPNRILAVTFTNKAAKEMRERLENLIGPVAKRMWLGTFHALCARMLRVHGERIGINPRFAIFDTDDSTRLIKEILKDLNLDTQRFPPARVLGRISDAKNALKTVEQVAAEAVHSHQKVYAQLYGHYQRRLREVSALDFDDLLGESVRLLQQSPESLEHWSGRFLHVLIDEFQDVNEAQFQWARLLASKHNNICVVGDDDQCLAEGTLVTTPDGDKPIEQIVAGDEVLCGAGRGTTTQATVEKVITRQYQGTLIRATTAEGRVLNATPNHMCFARLGVSPDVHYVYLMYRRDKGYRIGITVGARSDGRREQLQNGLQVRVNQEGADKVWILRVCKTRAEAAYTEQLLAFKFGIPTLVFFVAGRGKLTLTQEMLDEFYESIDTRTRAARLMEQMNLDVNHPHYRPSGLCGADKLHRMTVHLTAFGGNSPSIAAPWFRHRVWLNTSDKMMEEQVERSGIATRVGSRGTWRVERSYKEFARTAQMCEQIAQSSGADIARWASLTEGNKFAFQPAAHLRPSMIVPVWEDGAVTEDEIVSVEEIEYSGAVYDLNVADLHNYTANEIIVHNSIYAWRGADVKIILDFEKRYPDAQVVRLEQNYRSTQNILDAAYGVISHNFGRADKKLWSEEKGGEEIALHGSYNAVEEASWVVRQIEILMREERIAFADCAILCRVNAQSRPFEESFMRSRMPLKLVGTQRFYERREIRDVMAYLKFLYNPDDGVSAARLINTPPRGIGAVTVTKLQNMASGRGVSLGAILLDKDAAKELTPAIQRKVEPLRLALKHIFNDANKAQTLADLVERVLERTQFLEYLDNSSDKESVDRVANVEEFVRAAESFDLRLAEELDDQGETLDDWDEKDPLRLGQFLSETALQGGTDKDAQSDDAVTLMTLHAAKGLEFPIVFLVGLEQGLLPHARAVFSDGATEEELEEERRLMYVGLTRARKRAILTFAAQRTLHGRTESTMPSQFIDEIPAHLLRRSGVAGGGSPIVQQRRTSWGQDDFKSLPRPAEPSTPAPVASTNGGNSRRAADKPAMFKVGDRLRHKSYGEGLVVAASQNGGAGEWVEVAFLAGDAGKKKLIVAYANLEKVE